MLCCESDSKLEKLRFLETANSGGLNGVVRSPNLHCFFSLATREKSAPE